MCFNVTTFSTLKWSCNLGVEMMILGQAGSAVSIVLLNLEGDGEPVHHVQAGVALQVSSLTVILDLPHYDLHTVEVQGILVIHLAVQQGLSVARLIQKLSLCISNALLSLVRENKLLFSFLPRSAGRGEE